MKKKNKKNYLKSFDKPSKKLTRRKESIKAMQTTTKSRKKIMIFRNSMVKGLNENCHDNCDIDLGLLRKYAGFIIWNSQLRRWEL